MVELFLTFDDEMIKYRNTFTELDIKRSTLIKDFLRENFVKEMVTMINQVYSNLNTFQSHKKIISNCTRVIAQLIDWNALTLFQDCVEVVMQLMNSEEFQSDGLLVLNAIVNKGRYVRVI